MNTIKAIATIAGLLVFFYIIWKLKFIIISVSIVLGVYEAIYMKKTGKHSKVREFIDKYNS